MAKPIVIFKIRNAREIDSIREALEKKLDDYHVFVFDVAEQEEWYEIEAYYEKDLTEIQYQELKALITSLCSDKLETPYQ